jgi:hypothetical protein
VVSRNQPAESRSSGEAFVGKRADGEFDVVCTKRSQVMSAINERGLYWSGGAILSHRYEGQQHTSGPGSGR